MGLLYGPRRALLGGKKLRPFDFALPAVSTFTAGMAKRAGGTFAAAPIVQGKWDGTGTGDVLTAPIGVQIFDEFYANADAYQGTIHLWITPEHDGGGIAGDIFNLGGTPNIRATIIAGGALWFAVHNQSAQFANVAGWTAGTTYHLVFRWDVKKTLDGTNYACVSTNGSHSFGITSQPTVSTPDTYYFGAETDGTQQINAIFEGYRTDRRVWYEATSGTGEPYYFDANGYIDEIAAAYDAGAGADPASVEASWDGCMCLPTDSAVGALVTGTGEAWSHPHASALLNNTWLEDGFGPNQQDVVSFNGTSTLIDCGSAAALDDIPAGGGDITIGVWIKLDAAHSGNEIIVTKGAYITSGWFLYACTDGTIGFYVNCDTTDGSAFTTTAAEPGKWYYIAASYNDTTKAVEIAIDGRWEAADNTVGAYTSDAATSLVIGRRATAALLYFTGDIGHVSIWSDDHHTAGTDFIPPRTKPGAGGTLVESWGLDDGTGATAVATVTSPGNDGTIANGTWTEKWEYTGTPLELTSLEFDGAATSIVIPDAASIQDLHDAAFTVEGWIRADGYGEVSASGGHFVNKAVSGDGWAFRVGSTVGLLGQINCATANGTSQSGLDDFTADGRWHHVAMTWNDAVDLFPRLWIDGVEPSYVLTTNRNGLVSSDIGDDLYLGNRSVGDRTFDGGMSWMRISDSIRYTDTFLPPTRVNPPADDGNTVSLWYFDEGAEATVADQNANANDGTITFGAGQWWNTFAQEYDAPGSRTYAWGYSIGSDGAADGVEQHIAVTAGDDWVLRVPVRYEDATAQARILVYDESNAAAVSTFDGPPRTGLHSGANNSATLTVANEFFPASLIDGIIYNITDSSFGTITAVGGTNQDTITAALGSGGDNDWDTNDVFMLMPPLNWVWAEPFCVEMPAGCTEASVQLLNAGGDGVLHWQQAEVQESLVSNGSLEVGAGNPWIPTGFSVTGAVGLGELVQDVAEPHSGSSCLQAVNVGVGGVRLQISVANGAFAVIGGWAREFSGVINYFHQALMQSTLSTELTMEATGDVWALYQSVVRYDAVNRNLYTRGTSDPSSGRWDDIYTFRLDDVSLTVTPASEANSLEGTGIRVDGRDTCTQVPTVGILKATRGWIRFRWRPRHSAAQAVAFGETGITTDIFDGRAPIANAIQLYWAAANMIQLIVDDGGPLGIVWNATGLVVADTEYLVEIRYYPARADLLIDGVIVATGAAAIDFGTDIITLANYGHNNVNADQTDAVFSAP